MSKNLIRNGPSFIERDAIVRHIAKTYIYPEAAIRVTTWSPEKPNALALTKPRLQVLELVRTDLDDKHSLVSAFRGADVVYHVIDYWNI